MVAQRLDIINLAYFGTARPSAYHVPANLLPSFTLNDFGPEVDGFSAWALKPGWYAISATSLRLGLLYTHWDLYAPFRARQPDARIGRSIWVYHSTYPSTEVDRTVVLGPIAGDLDQATLGGDPDRQLIVKWAGSDAAVLNMNGPARYVVRGGEPIVGFAPDVHTALVAQALGLGSDASGELRLFEIDARPALETKLKSLALGVVQSPDLRPIDLPVEFEGGLTLMGYDLAARPDGSIDLVTYWQARPPVQAGLSVFAHVLDDADQIVGQGDGLDVRLSSLESGDVILQHFTISLDKAATPSELHIDLGLYDPSSGERSPIPLQTGRSIDRLRIRLGP